MCKKQNVALLFYVFFLKERNFLHVNVCKSQTGNSTRTNQMANFFLRAPHDAEYIIYHLSVQVTACSFNSQLSVEKRHYVLKHFFSSLLFFFSFFFCLLFGHMSDFRPSHRILSHSRPPSNLLPDSLFLGNVGECITAPSRIHLWATTTRFEYIPRSAGKYTPFLKPRRHRDASHGADPNNRIVCYTMLKDSRVKKSTKLHPGMSNRKSTVIRK